MTELADLIPDPQVDLRRLFRRGRVISVNGRSLTVDLDSGPAGIVIPSYDSCNPVPDQWVDIRVDGSTMIAVGAINGDYRQPTLIATSDQTATVTGLVNGVSRAVTKVGSFTAVAGEEFPLVWSADGSGVWVLAKAGAAYTPPPSGGGGGGGSTPGSYTTNYAPQWSGWEAPGVTSGSGDLNISKARQFAPNGYGYYKYATGRFSELSSRTILSGRIYMPRVSGDGTVSLMINAGPSFTTVTPSGWVALAGTRINELIARSSAGPVDVRLASGAGIVKGIPAGTVQIVWR